MSYEYSIGNRLLGALIGTVSVGVSTIFLFVLLFGK
ncbi:hypothetical protein Ga0451573_001722 [Peptococcaceae bacterium DYL19]|nr:hypothetical protein [Phosphitispora fastidiosa]